ncbi:DeoR/GlpR transcriptional regulator [Nocardioides mangrovicus]|uniref:Lactose phosphotransferase system repressor n=1 Tax=Nocardioides mangrovicus TaxID=2478913 RepID=A0A3L8NZU6_9ACTN|nr:DeoR/GlpR family DNA-binding transcription regulator [Nocardioides mangrovicus]RLV48301.1 DeoR/GlpR transcriptional regulator [Nocardioides mangrovicus]
MITRERQNRIVRALRSDGAASVRQLAADLAVSESTIRRDLEVLDRNGELTRTYGGAVVHRPGTTVEEHGLGVAEGRFADDVDVDLKRRVAAAAAARIADGQVVVLDIGTTTPLVARELRGRDVTVVTTNLAVLHELENDESVRLILLGGVLRRNYRSLVGSMAVQGLAEVSADVVMLSCTGVRPNGHVVDNMAVEAPIKRAMIAASQQIVLLATERKFPGTGALRLCSVADVDAVVTTEGAPAATLDIARQAGGEVVVA